MVEGSQILGLGNTRIVSAIACSLLVIQAFLLSWISWHTSPTLNEVAHLPSGLYAWKFGSFDVYRVNPPLARSIAAIPALVGGANTNWKEYEFGLGLRPEWALGKSFIQANPKRWQYFYLLARWALVPLATVGGLVCFRWSSSLYGPKSGLLSLTLWVFSPNILAWASTITPDASAAGLGVLACYNFWRWLESPTWRRSLVSGLALGLAELAKMTWILLYALWPVIWLFYCLSRPRSLKTTKGTSQLTQLIFILLLSLYIINLGYGFDGSFKRLRTYQFACRFLAGTASQADGGKGGNRFSNTWVGLIPVPVPEDYLLGLDLQQLDFDLGALCYINETWRDNGSLAYYVYAFALKEPLGTWLLGLLALGASAAWRSGRTSRWRDEIVLISPAIAVMLAVSSVTSFNEHSRYALPALPFFYIWIGKVVRREAASSLPKTIVVTPLLFWSIASSLSVFPHSLSHFNELAGGPVHGHVYLIGSNIDWGQDLFDLKRWYDEHPQARPLHLAYFGAVDPDAAGIDFVPIPKWPLPDRPSNITLEDVGPQPGWHAISVNHLRGYRRFARDRPSYEYFLQAQPISMAGYSIYIFHFSWDEANAMRRKVGLPELRRP